MSKPPVYNKEELEEKIARLNKIASEINQSLKIALDHLYNVEKRIAKELNPIGYIEYAHDLLVETIAIQCIIDDAIDAIIATTLYPDPDIERYEREYNVSFGYDTESLIGVVLLREGGKVKPVVIWRSGANINYWEGEPRAEDH